MKRNPILEAIRQKREKYIDVYVDFSYELSKRIIVLMEEQGMDQSDLAKALGKHESEISKWLGGSHNFTLKTLAKIQIALNNGKLFEICGNETAKVIHNEIVIVINEFDQYDVDTRGKKLNFKPFNNRPQYSSLKFSKLNT